MLRERDSNPRHLAYETKLEPLQSIPQCVLIVRVLFTDLDSFIIIYVKICVS